MALSRCLRTSSIRQWLRPVNTVRFFSKDGQPAPGYNPDPTIDPPPMYMKENEVDICVPHQETTLEWIIPSPPPAHCFEEPPLYVYCNEDSACKWVNPGAH